MIDHRPKIEGRCDICGSELITRADDTPEAARDWVRKQQNAARRRLFEAAVPAEYREALYDDLDAAQQGRDAVAGWLASTSRTLLLTGPTGTGKTHAAYAVLRDAAERGLWVYGASIGTFIRALQPGAVPSPVPKMAEQAEVFLFDDLGAERATEWVVEQVGEVFDHRYREQRRQIITTNSTRDGLEQRLGPRAVSRLAQDATVVRFDGPDRRVSW